jgi:hypothetical protein
VQCSASQQRLTCNRSQQHLLQTLTLQLHTSQQLRRVSLLTV